MDKDLIELVEKLVEIYEHKTREPTPRYSSQYEEGCVDGRTELAEQVVDHLKGILDLMRLIEYNDKLSNQSN